MVLGEAKRSGEWEFRLGGGAERSDWGVRKGAAVRQGPQLLSLGDGLLIPQR